MRQETEVHFLVGTVILGFLSMFKKSQTCVSGNLGCCLKEVKPLVIYDGEQGIALEPMQGNLA